MKNHLFDSFYVHSSHPNATRIAHNETFTQVGAKCTAHRRVGRDANKSLLSECAWE